MPPPLPNRQLRGKPALCDSIRSLPFSSRCHPGAFISCQGDDERVRLRRPQASVVETILEPCALPRAHSLSNSSPLLLPDAHPVSLHFGSPLIARSPPLVHLSAEGALTHCQWAWLGGSRHRSHCQHRRIRAHFDPFLALAHHRASARLSAPQDSERGLTRSKFIALRPA